MFANTSGGGLAFAFADTLLTPPAMTPVPYPNNAHPAMGVGPVPNVIINGAPAHNMRTKIPISDGNNAGVTGVASGTTAGPESATTGSATVLFGGAPVTRLSDTTQQNAGNASGSYVVPSQTTVLVLS